jgi:hypothetical protein
MEFFLNNRETNTMTLVNQDLTDKYKLVAETINSMTSQQAYERPNCRELLSRIDSWTLSYDELKQFKEFIDFKKEHIDQENFRKKKDNFYKNYLKKKLERN